MSANRTRVQVRGSIGKSVRFPTGTSGSGATIGVDFALPDGSIPTLQQLAAALATGAAIQDQPGNIVPPGGGPVVIWQNVQYIPANVIFPARPVAQEDDAGEDYARMAVPGPIGPRGFQGFDARLPEDPEDPLTQPGPPGAAGAAGAAGAPGVMSTVHLWPDDAEDPGLIPGAAGPPGAAGASIQGAPGVNIAMWPDDPEDPGLIPGAAGPPGAAGAAGAPGVMSTVHLWPDDAEDPGLIPGAPGQSGAPGAAGGQGVFSTVHLYPEDVEDPWLVPGPKGDQGIQGIPGTNGTSSSATGAVLGLEPDDPEDVIREIQTSVGPLTTGQLLVHSAAGRISVQADDRSTYAKFGGPFTIACSNGSYPSAGMNAAATGTVNVYNYEASDFANVIFYDTGTFKFQTAPSGTAGNPITFTTRFTITNLGLLQAPNSPLGATITQVLTGLCAVKTSTTTSVNNTLTADATLTITLNETGKYHLEIYLQVFETTTSTGGFQFDLNSGTVTLSSLGYGFNNASISSAVVGAAISRATAITFGTVSVSSATPSYVKAEGFITVSVAGTLAVRWAQLVTSAGLPTSLMLGSFIKATKIA